MEASGKLRVCLMTVLAGLSVYGGTNALPSPHDYGVIAERNSFALQPPGLSPSSSQPTLTPREDLFLTGLSKVSSSRYAFFKLTTPGGLSSNFALREGEQNEWLEIQAINFEDATVKAILKKPVVRARGVGTEIIFSLQAHGVAPIALTPTSGQQPVEPMAPSGYDTSTMTSDSNGSSPDPLDEQAAQRKSELNTSGPHGFAQN
jgi:hypothetical protein